MSSAFGSDFTRSLWTDTDHILLVYVGSAAEFALVEENHWLFYTNKLPSAPLNRLVSTLVWNRKVMEIPQSEAIVLAKTIRGFHDTVEDERRNEEGGAPKISNKAFRAVGAMLIDYAILAEEYLSGTTVSDSDCETYYKDQKQFFEAMGITGWEDSYDEYRTSRTLEIQDDLLPNVFTDKLFDSYRQDLGWFRYTLLHLFMGYFLTEEVRAKVNIPKRTWFKPAYALYPLIHGTALAKVVHVLLLPKRVRNGLS